MRCRRTKDFIEFFFTQVLNKAKVEECQGLTKKLVFFRNLIVEVEQELFIVFLKIDFD